jgi:hypothetical protein
MFPSYFAFIFAFATFISINDFEISRNVTPRFDYETVMVSI